jgi:hypothetical protein
MQNGHGGREQQGPATGRARGQGCRYFATFGQCPARLCCPAWASATSPDAANPMPRFFAATPLSRAPLWAFGKWPAGPCAAAVLAVSSPGGSRAELPTPQQRATRTVAQAGVPPVNWPQRARSATPWCGRHFMGHFSAAPGAGPVVGMNLDIRNPTAFTPARCWCSTPPVPRRAIGGGRWRGAHGACRRARATVAGRVGFHPFPYRPSSLDRSLGGQRR